MSPPSAYARVLEDALSLNQQPVGEFDPQKTAPVMRLSDMREMGEVLRRFLGGAMKDVYTGGPVTPMLPGSFRLVVNATNAVPGMGAQILFRTDFHPRWLGVVRERLQAGVDVQVIPERGRTIPLLIDGAYVGILLLAHPHMCPASGRQFSLLMQPEPDWDAESPVDYFADFLTKGS